MPLMVAGRPCAKVTGQPNWAVTGRFWAGIAIACGRQVAAIMHSSQLCALGTSQSACSLAGRGRATFDALHNFSAFGKSSRAPGAGYWRSLAQCFQAAPKRDSHHPLALDVAALNHPPTQRTDPMWRHADFDGKLQKHGNSSHSELCSECCGSTPRKASIGEASSPMGQVYCA